MMILRTILLSWLSISAYAISNVEVSSRVVNSATFAKKKRQLLSPLATTTTGNDVLSIRGGAGPLDLEKTGNAVIILKAIKCASFFLCPEEGHKQFFKGGKTTPKTPTHLEFYAFLNLSIWITAFCALIKETTVNTACGAGLVPLVGWAIKNYSSEAAALYGKGTVNLLLGSGLLAYALLTDASYAPKLLKIWSGLYILGGVIMCVDPSKVLKDDPKDDTRLDQWKGSTMVSAGLLNGALATGSDALTAIGYSFVPSLLMALKEVVTGSATPQVYFVALVSAIVTGTLAIPAEAAAPIDAAVA